MSLQLKSRVSLSYFVKMETNWDSPVSCQPTAFAMTSSGEGGESQKTEIDFISQFLELPINQSSLHHHPTLKSAAQPLPTKDAATQTLPQPPSNPQNLAQHPSCNSIFHNFQKHIVRTLKNAIRLKSAHRGVPALKMARKMWQIFLSSRLYSKKILYFLFGVTDLTPQQNCLEIRNYGIEQAESLLLSYSVDQFSAAQAILREEVVAQGMKLLQGKGFCERRMQNSEAFSSYFLSFLQELQMGPLNRRLPKSEKLLILQESGSIKQQI